MNLRTSPAPSGKFVSLLKRLDAFLLHRAEFYAHLLQRLTGLTSFFVAKMGMLYMLVGLLIVIANYFHQFLSYPTRMSGLIVLSVTIPFYLMIAYVVARVEQEYAHDDTLPALLEIMRRNDWHVRLLIVTIAVGQMGLEIKDFWSPLQFVAGTPMIGLALYDYFIAVNPLPPCRGKIREFLESLGQVRVPVRVTND